MHNLLFAVFILLYDPANATSNQWQQVPLRTQAQKTAGLAGGEGMQQIWAIAYAPSNTHTVYLITDTAGVVKSTDGGAIWQHKHIGFRANGGYSIAVDPNNENIVLAYSNNMSSVDAWGSVKGVYRTTDGGDTWALVRAATTGYNPLQGARGGRNIVFVDSNTVYAGSQNEGLFKSINGGATWFQVNLSELNGDTIYDIRVHPDNPAILFVVSYTDNKLYRVTSDTAVVQIGVGLTQSPVSMAIVGN